jgi:Fatty acid desaturase
VVACRAPMELVLSDPIPAARDSRAATSFGERLALRFIYDARDIPFLKLIALTTATVIPTGVLLFLPGMFRWWLAALHLGLVLYFLGPFVLMLHNTSHRRLFRSPFGRLNHFIPWVLGPFFGESPETYFAHHVGMHHPENNVGPDISTTLDYQRDSLFGFTRYFLRFFFCVLYEISRYFVRKRRHALMIRTLAGEFSFFAAVVALSFVSWRASLAVFVVPFVTTRILMMAGNWAQHAFVDRDAPDNCYRNSITCINSGYNRRCFNDGYHIGHHIKQTRHWTEMPEDFLRNVVTYEKERAIVFSGVDFNGVWLLLMLKRYDTLAGRIVQLGDTPRSRDEIVAMLKSRTRWTRPAGDRADHRAARRAA